jgi:hypothetical protein
MRWYRWPTVAAALAALVSGPVAAQQPTGMRGMSAGMGMSHDTASARLMTVIHQLFADHDRITRTVTNLPNGVRALTESDDPRLARLLKEHTADMTQRLAKGEDPNLPPETPTVHTLFRNADKIRTVADTTAKGVVIVQTSDDPQTVAALQKHAADVTDFVREGMSALHRAMMSSGTMMHRMPIDTAASAHAAHAAHVADSSFAALQARGKVAMGVDQYTSTHHFDPSPDGGRIELQRDVDDTAGVAQIRAHLQAIAKAFAAGDFTTPAFVHMQDVPGTSVMAAKRAAITYTYRALPRGGEVRITTKDRDAISAIHEFLAFQRKDHHAP